VRGGFLNYLFVTPEVHRWHHSAQSRKDTNIRAITAWVAFWDVVFRNLLSAPERRPDGDARPSGILRIAGRRQLSETIVGPARTMQATPAVYARSCGSPWRRPAARR
jgi:hypothetical protein